MPLSWNEIRERAGTFSKIWENESSENAEAKSFWDDFFKVFGVSRKRLASFETPVKKGDGKGGFVDLLWKGVLIVEHKSAGKDLDRATKQALEYFPGLKDHELPRYVVVSDFQRLRLYDLEALDGKTTHVEFQTKDLYKHVKLFGFMLGFTTQKVAAEAPVNLRAIERLSVLHDKLEATHYTGRSLEILLTRLVFCFFADDTSIFERQQFKDWISSETREDGSDIGSRLNELFEILDTPENKRSTVLSETLAAFPYVNGGLFETRLPTPSFSAEMRDALLSAAALEWSQISPAIFGALFQGLMSREERRKLGAHYTRERNILRVIKPLFLDELRREFEASKRSKQRLQELHQRLRAMRFLDPACGCGNFLVVTYRELRKLELDILRVFYDSGTQHMLPGELDQNVWLNVDQFYGIELDEKAIQIARLALWLTDHQMNLLIGEEFGTYFRRLPLKSSPNIIAGNALRIDWKTVVAPDDDLYVLGNPPFIGAKNMDAGQRADADQVFKGIQNAGLIDFVAAWYVLAARFIRGTHVRVAFVSTNSITQGEQVGVLWGRLLGQGCKIHFAHRTFQWSNEARGVASVHCVVIGFGMDDLPGKLIFEYDDIKDEPRAVPARNINPYLVDFDDVVLARRSAPICKVPKIGVGNKPIDGGHYLFTPAEKKAFIEREPGAAKLFRRWIGSAEFLNGVERWCLLLKDCTPSEIRKMPAVLARVQAVQKFRRGVGPNSEGAMPKKMPPESTRKLGDTPLQFHVENFPTAPYLVLPETSSERREYIPLAFEEPPTLPSSLVRVAPAATLFHFGVLSSAMHNAWVRYTCGRLKSDYRYSVSVVYNNFPWPSDLHAREIKAVEKAALTVLSTRAKFSSSSLADLYDPLTMPSEILKAHRDLDRSVEAAYGKVNGFKSEVERVVFLFERYVAMTTLLPGPNSKFSGRVRAMAG